MATDPRSSLSRDEWDREDAQFSRIVRGVQRRARAEERVRGLGLAFLILNGLGMVGAALAFLAIAPWGFVSGDPTATFVLGGVGTVVAGLIAGLSLPGVLAGWGLLRRRPWARTLALAMGVLSLFSVPLGTILGVVTLYVLLQDDVRELFDPLT
ncbi:MAG: hypothetical protein CL910_01970 [Deltaproteobacteria bacterium]|jgi:hypothetical protein|nr:hypothetical protein [Deltaproteobacteria bacterium]